MVRFQTGVEGAFLGHSINKITASSLSAASGLGVCFAFVWLSQALGMSVRFPAPGGEDDFALRALYFFVGVCPAFAILGAWIGFAGFNSVRRYLSIWSGALIGGGLVFVLARVLQPQIESLSKHDSANFAVLAFYIAWIVLSVGGAMVARRLHSR